MEMSVMQWEFHYETLRKEILNKRKTGIIYTEKEVAELNVRVRNLEKTLKTIQDSPMEYEVSSSEIARRQLILENIKKQIISFASTNMTRTGAAAGAVSNAPSASTGATTHNPLNVSDRGLALQQQQMIKEQDKIMLDIEKGVSRLHEQARDIGTEARIHNQILEQLDVNVDIATAGLTEETKHAEDVRRSSRMCKLYICVAVEVIVLVILIIAWVMKKN